MQSTKAGGAEQCALVAASHLSQMFDVVVLSAMTVDPERLERLYGLDLSRVRFTALGRHLPDILRRLATGHPRLYRAYEDFERALEFLYQSRVRALDLDLLINTQWGSNLLCPSKMGLYLCLFPHPVRSSFFTIDRDRFLGMTRSVQDSYQIVPISRYTSEWTQRLWRPVRLGKILYPPCMDMGPPAPKKPWILHTGRFVNPARADYKHQLQLIEAFKSGFPRAGSWELHLAGSLVKTSALSSVQSALEDSARGWPVHFHFDVDPPSLRELYRQSAIYWHSTGLGHPERPQNQEHFGIATVEAMSAGAVPVVINSGGQKEIVSHGETGYLWSSPRELIVHTQNLVENPGRREQLSGATVLASARFSRAAFAENLDQLVKEALERT